jgi:hypothetical protein
MTTPDPSTRPLILDAKGELLFFRSAAHLSAYVEAVDVSNGEYGACWDPDGRLFELRVERRTTAARGLVSLPAERVIVVPVEEKPPDRWGLHRALLLYIADVGLQESDPLPSDTAELLQFAIEQTGWVDWQARATSAGSVATIVRRLTSAVKRRRRRTRG